MSDTTDTPADRLALLEKQAAANQERLDALAAHVQSLRQQVAAKAKRNRPGEETP
jgi:hypothetical protein